MTLPVQALPTLGNPNSTEDSKIRSCLSELQTILTASLDTGNLTTSTLQLLGLNSGTQVGRGKCSIATEETRSNVAYGTLTTPDVVAGIDLTTDGLIAVAYQALWKESNSGQSLAAIFVGANQLKSPTAGGAPGISEENNAGTANIYVPLVTNATGLFCPGAFGSDSSFVTTGMTLGYPSSNGAVCFITASAGTYDISVQFRAAAGSVTAKNRKLWVWTLGF